MFSKKSRELNKAIEAARTALQDAQEEELIEEETESFGIMHTTFSGAPSTPQLCDWIEAWLDVRDPHRESDTSEGVESLLKRLRGAGKADDTLEAALATALKGLPFANVGADVVQAAREVENQAKELGKRSKARLAKAREAYDRIVLNQDA